MTNDRVALLREARLFESFSDEECRDLGSRFSEHSYSKGETLWRAGDAADEFLIVAYGELTVWNATGQGAVARLGPGSAVGEMALLLDTARSTTVTASRDTRALALTKEEFKRWIQSEPRAVAAISEMLSRRLRQTTSGTKSAPTSLIIAVVATENEFGSSLVACALAQLLERDTGQQVQKVDVSDRGEPLPGPGESWAPTQPAATIAVARAASTRETISALSRLVATVSKVNPIVVLDAPVRSRLEPAALARVADVLVVLEGESPADVPDDPHTRVLRVRNLWRSAGRFQSGADFTVPHVDVVSGLPAPEAARALVADPAGTAMPTLERLARTIERRVVGIALGAGAALGLAHIGVLRRLESAGIPIDVIAGSSIGAIVSLGYAATGQAEHVETAARALSSFARLVGTVDVATTGDGLLAGRRLLSYFRPFLHGQKTFDDLRIPARAVATDLRNGESVAIGHGELEHAIRASIAMPPFVTPVVEGDRVLVDGGIINPVPCDVVRDMGADIVVAVNVVPPIDAHAETLLTNVSRGLNRVNPFAYLSGRLDSLNLFDIVMHSFQIVEHRLGNYLAGWADVVIEPDLRDHTWIEFYNAPAIMEKGAIAGEESIDVLQEVLSRRLAESIPDRPVV